MDAISPKYLMKLIAKIEKAVTQEFSIRKDIFYYVKRWHREDSGYGNWENFSLINNDNGDLDVLATLHTIDPETLLQMAVDLGVETPDFIPSVATFKNDIKSSYQTAIATFEKASRQIENHPDVAIGLVNSALESILKEILKDDRIKTKSTNNKTLYELTSELLKELELFPNSGMPQEVKVIGSGLLAVSQGIEKLRSTKTMFHGKTSEDYLVTDAMYAYFIVNTVATIGLFLNSFYKKKFPIVSIVVNAPENVDDLPF